MLSFTTTVRRLLKDKLFSALNITGLGVGIACCVLVALYLRDELSYERHFSKADRIYRIGVTLQPSDGNAAMELATNAPPLAPLMQADFDEVEAYARVASWRPAVQVDGGDALYLPALLADASLFELFDFTWLAGDPATALQQPSAVVLTASAAQRLFGSADVLGRSLNLPDQQIAMVTGVLADLPTTTHLQFDMLAPIALAAQIYNPRILDSWFTQAFHTYILLKPGTTIDTVQPRLSDLIARHLDQEAAGVFLQQAVPLRDLHLHSNRRNELSTPGSMTTVLAAALIAVVILGMACINFTNLATAQAAQRAKEIGVRKAIGANRGQLLRQFLGESLLMAALATAVGSVLVELSLPAFNALLQKNLRFDLLQLAVSLPLLLLTLVVGVVAGLYPALYLSSHQPTAVLRGVVSCGKHGLWLRNLLVIVQFSAAIALLVCTATLYLQVDFIRNQNPGYDHAQVVVLSNLGREGVGRQWDAIKQQLQSIPGVEHVTAAHHVPTQVVNRSYFLHYEGGSERRTVTTVLADADYLETFGLTLLAGEGWTPGQPSYLLSATAAQQLGWSPQDAIGKWIDPGCCGFQRALVSGVVQDVQYGAFHTSTGPVLYAIPPEPTAVITSETRLGLEQIAIKVAGNNFADALVAIDRVWQQFRPDHPITRALLDDQFATLYREEERQGRMLMAFAGLAIFIACLGLYGLAAFNAQRRTKEIGVRKVMGSSVWQIVLLLTNDFSRLVLLSNLLAWPIAYYAMNRWLENFAYRIDLTPLIFIGSGLIALCIAWVTVGGTAAKAASQKPVLALRYE
jgi:putative ABC transport system permease protein